MSNKDLDMFLELIKEEIPDCEINETLFAYYSDLFQSVITKISETNDGVKSSAIYKLQITGDLVYTRHILGKENVLVKAYLVINEYFKQDETNYEEDFAGSRYSTGEFED
jgi:hypothetical protein